MGSGGGGGGKFRTIKTMYQVCLRDSSFFADALRRRDERGGKGRYGGKGVEGGKFCIIRYKVCKRRRIPLDPRPTRPRPAHTSLLDRPIRLDQVEDLVEHPRVLVHSEERGRECGVV